MYFKDRDLKTIIEKLLIIEKNNRQLENMEYFPKNCLVFENSKKLEDIWSIVLDNFVQDYQHKKKRGVK